MPRLVVVHRKLRIPLFFRQARFNVSLRETRFSSRLRAAPLCLLPSLGDHLHLVAWKASSSRGVVAGILAESMKARPAGGGVQTVAGRNSLLSGYSSTLGPLSCTHALYCT